MDRGVEVLNGGAASGTLPEGEVIDLTSANSKGVVDEPAEETKPLVEGDEGYVAPGEPKVEPELGADGKPVVPVKDEKKPEGEKEDDADAPQYFFGDQQVDIEVPEEIGTALTEAGLDEKAVMAELFAKDGKFELKPETRAKLDEKFGKLMVDGYLKMYKGLNDQQMAEIARQTQSAEEATKAIQTEYAEIVGGAEGLEALEAYVLTLDEKQIASYNAVMGGDSWDAQKMVLGMLRGQMAAADKERTGDKEVKLLGDGDPAASLGSGDVTDKGFLTGAEYQTLMDSDKYWTDPAYQRKVDTMRATSIRQGK